VAVLLDGIAREGCGRDYSCKGAIKEPAAMSGFFAKLPAATHGSEDTSLARGLLLLGCG
jgi:hypothetical protein